MRYFILTAVLVLSFACSDHSDVNGTWMNLEGNIMRIDPDGKAFVAQEGLEGGQSAKWDIHEDTLRLTVGTPGEDESWNEYLLKITPDTLYMVSIFRHMGDEVDVLDSGEMARRMGRPPERMHFSRHGEKI